MNGPESHIEAGLILERDRCSYGCPHTGCPHEMAMLAAAVVYQLQALTAAVIATGAHKLMPADRHEWLTATDPERFEPEDAEVTRSRREYPPFDLANQAIGLFLEYRDAHGHSEDDARRAAALEVAEGAAVTDADLGRQDPSPARPAGGTE